MRKYGTFSVPSDFKKKLNQWLLDVSPCCVLDSHTEKKQFYPGGIEYDLLAAAGEVSAFTESSEPFEELDQFVEKNHDWIFGYLSYDLKNKVEKLTSENDNLIQAPIIQFFCPQVVVYIKDNELTIGSYQKEPQKILDEIEHTEIDKTPYQLQLKPQPRISHANYIRAVLGLKHHIQIGDIYEVNFCQEFLAEGTIEQPLRLWEALVDCSPTPFSGYFTREGIHVLCASPERYLKKNQNQLISQPIKGTAKRGATEEEDELIKQELKSSIKERSENVMIVDLVRNDLSRIATKNSVQVDELCGIYTFPQVHQQISTVSAQIKPNLPLSKAFKSTFPMGSMTGAPKVKAMELIEEFESNKRGIYSGSIGYIDPDGNFDFNVVIRSMIYNHHLNQLSFSVGGAITSKSDPEAEYQESLLKAKAILEVLARLNSKSQD